MEDFKDKDLTEIEEQIKAGFDSIELEPFSETLEAIKPHLKKKKAKNWFVSHRLATRAMAVTASLVMLLAIGFGAWVLWPKDDGSEPPVYRYEDVDIDLKDCEKVDVTSIQLYLPNLNTLLEPVKYRVGVHKESLKSVYYLVNGYHSDGDTGRIITLTIILEPQYELFDEELYTDGNKITVSNTEISVCEDDPQFPFNCYKIGFKKGNTRYYIDYQTTSVENDVESFMLQFLT